MRSILRNAKMDFSSQARAIKLSNSFESVIILEMQSLKVCRICNNMTRFNVIRFIFGLNSLVQTRDCI